MAGVNTAEYLVNLQTLFNQYLAAEQCILTSGQEYTIGDRTLRRGDLKAIQNERQRIANEIAKLQAGKGARFSRVIPAYDS